MKDVVIDYIIKTVKENYSEQDNEVIFDNKKQFYYQDDIYETDWDDDGHLKGIKYPFGNKKFITYY